MMRKRKPGVSKVPASGSTGSTWTTTHHRAHSARSTSAAHTASTGAGITASERQRYSGACCASDAVSVTRATVTHWRGVADGPHAVLITLRRRRALLRVEPVITPKENDGERHERYPRRLHVRARRRPAGAAPRVWRHAPVRARDVG